MIIKVSIPNRFQLKTIPSFRTVLMPRQGEVHYIGGADILPAPLETEGFYLCSRTAQPTHSTTRNG